MEPGDITRRRAWIAVASVICMLSATIHRAEADDTHFSLPADLGSQPSAGIAERAESAGATIGREHDLVRAYLDEKEKIEPDRVPLLKPRWQSDPEAGHGADPTTMQRVMALSFAVPGVAKGFPFEDRCQRRSKISPPGRSKTSPLNVMRYAVLGGCPGSP